MFELTRRRARVLLVVFAALAVALGAFGSGLFDKVQGGGYSDPGSESARAATVLRDTLGEAAPNLVLLVETGSSVDDPAASAAATALARDLAAEPGIARVGSYWTDGKPAALRSADGGKGLIIASVLGTEAEVDARIGDLAARFGGTHDPVEVRVGGYAMLLRETVQQTEKDVVLGESIAFPVTLIALLVVFGGLVAAALPLVVAAVTVLMTVGALTLVASLTDVAATASNVATLLGLGLAIDYSLLLISRFRDELDGGAEPSAALAATMRSAGRTVAFSAVTVAIALAGLLFFPLVAVRSMGYAGLLVAALAALVSLTVLPALLLLLGHRIDSGRLRPRRKATGAAADGFWHRLATLVMRRPLPIGLAVAALLLLLGAPFLHVNLGFPDERALPADMASRQIAETLADEFGITEQNGLFAVLPDSADGVGGYALALSELPDVRRVDTVTGSYAGGMQFAAPGALHSGFGAEGAAYLNIVPSTSDPAALDHLVDAVREVPAPSPVLIGGIAATNDDALASITAALPWALGFVVLLMLVALFLLTGSVVLPVLALVLSALSLTATFGALVWIFQDGHLSGLLNFTVTGDLPPTVPVMLFGVAFGLAMDYQVFLLSRIGEEYRRTGDSEAAVALGLERIGRIVTAAAVLISLVLLGFLASDITFMKAFGIGLPLAVLVDATLVRGFLLPAGMKLLGDRVWYAPGFLRTVHARFGLDEGSPDPVPAGDAPARWLIDEKPSAAAVPVVAAAGVAGKRESAAFRSGRGASAAERNGSSSSRAVPSGVRGGSEESAGSTRGAKAGVAPAGVSGAASTESATEGVAEVAPAAVDEEKAASAGAESAVEDVVVTDNVPASIADADTPPDESSRPAAEVVAAVAGPPVADVDSASPTAEVTDHAGPEPVAGAAAQPEVEAAGTAAADSAAESGDPAPTAVAGTSAVTARTASGRKAATEAVPAEKATARKRAPRKAVAAEPVVAEAVSETPVEKVPAEHASRDAADPATPVEQAEVAPPVKRVAARKAVSAAGAAKKSAPRKTAARKAVAADVRVPIEDVTPAEQTAIGGAEPTPAKKTAPRKTTARKAATTQPEAPLEGAASAVVGEEPTPAKKVAPRKTAARKSAASPAKVPAEGAASAVVGDGPTPAEKAAPRKAAARKAVAAEVPPEGAAEVIGGEVAPAKKTAARKTAARKTVAAAPVEGAAPAETTARKTPAKRTSARKTTAPPVTAEPATAPATAESPIEPAATSAPVETRTEPATAETSVETATAPAASGTPADSVTTPAAAATSVEPTPGPVKRTAARKTPAAGRTPARRATRKAAPPSPSAAAKADATPGVGAETPGPGTAPSAETTAVPLPEVDPASAAESPTTATRPAKKTAARKVPAKRATARKTANPTGNGAATPAKRGPRTTTTASAEKGQEETP